MFISQIVYDGKYHPMDDVLRPQRAAKRRAKYEEDQPGSDSEATVSGAGDNVNIEGARRSSRPANGQALYDTNVQPQDEELQGLEEDNDRQQEYGEEDSGDELVIDETEQEEEVEYDAEDDESDGKHLSFHCYHQ